MIRGLDFFALPVQDMPRAVAFYQGTLGMAPANLGAEGCTPDDHWVEFVFGEQVLALGLVSAFGVPFVPVTAGMVGLQVEDVDAARAALEAKGVAFHGETFDSPVCRMVTFSDPDGNTLILHRRHEG